MWKGLGNLKSGLGDITSKTISSVAKAGSRAKELINQIDNEDFFEQEFQNENVLKNPLDNPLAKLDSKGKKKDDSSKSEKENSSSKGNSLNQLPLGEDIGPIKFDNSLPKIYSTKNQKAEDGSSSPSAQTANKSKKKNQPKEKTPSVILTESNQPQKQSEVSDNVESKNIQGTTEVIVEKVTKEERENTNTFSENKETPATKKETEKKAVAGKEEKAPINRELEELRNELNEKDEIVERFAIENDQLIKERNEIKSLADSYQEKMNALDKNLAQILGKNTKLEEQINQLQARQRSPGNDIHIPQERKETIDGYIHHCVEQYKTDISLKLVEDLNKDILEQLIMEEGEISEETKELMNLWIAAKPEFAADIIPTEKIIQPFYDENLLKEEIEGQKQENHQLKTKAEEYEERIRQLENQLQEERSASSNFKKETDQTLQKYIQDIESQKQENNQFKSTLEEYQEQIRQLQEEKSASESFKQENDQLRMKAEEYVEQIRQLQDQQSASDSFKKESDQLKTTLTEYQEQIRQLQDQQSASDSFKQENDQLKTTLAEYQEQIRQLQEQQSASGNLQQETDETLKKYTEEFIKLEQTIENMKEEIAEYKVVLNTRTEDLQKAEKMNQENTTQIKELQDKIRSETAAKEDLGQQYEGIVQGMKEFEKTMMDLNTENERLSSEYQTMKDQLDVEIKKAKENQHTLSVEVKNNLLEKLAQLNCFCPGYEIQSVINAGLKQMKNGRISSEELISLMDTELFAVIEKIYGKFNSELEEERVKEREKYNILAKNLEQVQGELKESEKREKKIQDSKEKLQKKNEELTAKVETLNTQATEKKNKIKELQKTINELQEAKRKYLDDVGSRNEEFEQLKIKFNALQEQATEAQEYYSRLENEASAVPELSARLEKQTIELAELSELVRSKEEENEHLNMTINNLQSVIDENQQIQENLSNQSYNEIKRLRNDFEQASRKSQILQEYKDKFEVIEKESADKEAKIKELNMKLKESEQERNAIKAEASALVNKAKNEAMYKDNLVDKRVLTNFLVKYFDSNATFAVKLGILETMSSILGCNDDDRSKLGLPRLVPLVEPKEEEEEKVENTTTTENEEKEAVNPEQTGQPQKSLKQLFMSFLQDNQ